MKLCDFIVASYCGLFGSYIMLLCDHIIYTGQSPAPQRFCDIYSPSFATSVGVLYISNGTQNVILYCICKKNNVAVGPTTWFIDYTAVTRTTASGDNPYYRDNVPSPLIIPYFIPTFVGTYGCGSYRPTEPSVTIDLAIIISGMIRKYICLYL